MYYQASIVSNNISSACSASFPYYLCICIFLLQFFMVWVAYIESISLGIHTFIILNISIELTQFPLGNIACYLIWSSVILRIFIVKAILS
jgi:hypothetical protein